MKTDQTTLVAPPALEKFSDPWKKAGYNDGSITDDLITDIYLAFIDQTRSPESQEHLRTLSGEYKGRSIQETGADLGLGDSLSLDNTMKVITKATVVDKNGTRVKLMKGGIISILNEHGEIISWVCTFAMLDLELANCSQQF